jgi:hypothetical protein
MLRASDSDRDRVADRLRHAAAEGRLLTEELEERLALVLRSRTYGELEAVVSDLPTPRDNRRHKTPLWAKATIAVAILMSVILVFAVVALLFIGLAGAWLIWLFIAWAILGKGGGRSSRPRRHSRPATYPRHRVNSTRGVSGGGSAWL